MERIPADIALISGEEIRARGATDMASALALVSGVEAPAGGDAGPSSAVPSFWGLHEFDAFLLVVDGIPWGGAFNPAITTLDFTDIKSVEVLKGAAPVTFGATSFVGVVQAIHYPAGEASDEVDLAYGQYGSVRGSISAALPPLGGLRQSIALDGQELGFADSRESVSNQRILYRGELDVGSGTLRLDADFTRVRDTPPSPIQRDGSSLTQLEPINANFNPSDAGIDENKYHLALGYSQPTPLGKWETLVSFAYSSITDVRAFLHPDLSGTADTQNQRREIDDGYFDTHLSTELSDKVMLLTGADLLYGLGQQTSLNGNGAYTVPLDGSGVPPPTSAFPPNEIGTTDDRRLFAGQYVQVDFKPDGHWDLLAGLRLNEAYEHKISSDLTLPPPELDRETVSKTMIRPSETVGVSYRVFEAKENQLVLYADFRNAFKPSALDFGPDFTPDLLSPETAQSYEMGVRGATDGGRVSYQAELFLMNFNNLVVPTLSGALANAAGEKLKGIELEGRYEFSHDLALLVNASYHEAKFSKYLFVDDSGAAVDVTGRDLPLSPRVLASMGVLYMPKEGFGATLVAQYVGRRFLDEENSAPVGGYLNLSASASYRYRRTEISLQGTNLTNQRPPVSASEFGSDSFYLLPARMLWVRLAYRWH
jgi:iron complex outermembrane receptor protein